MKKKLVALIMATVMSTALVACSGDSTADTKPKTETSVSSKDNKNTAKKDDKKEIDTKKADADKKKAETDKKKEEDKKKESEKKAEKTDSKETTKTASADKEKKPSNSNNSNSKPNNSTGNNNSNSSNNSQPSTPNNNGGNNSGGSTPTPTPPTEQPSKPNNDNNGNSGSNKPAEKPSEPEKPAPHICSFDTVVNTNPGNCQTASSTVKKCSCGKTTTVTGGLGSHNMVHHDAQGHDVNDYEYHAICGGCGADFGSGEAGANAALDHTMKDFNDGCVNYSSKPVPVGSHWEETSPAYDECSICGKR